MKEGWNGDEYVVLYSPDEANTFARICELNTALPGFALLGLSGWQDFIVSDSAGMTFTIPSVPIDDAYLSPIDKPLPNQLTSDERLSGKVKWLIKPLLFGGDPRADDNFAWITHQQYAELVHFWNDQYRQAKALGWLANARIVPQD
ncbi:MULTISPECIES: hypothetical protein [unclassified Achromobacter]|uniref:hypothetical protein n=1 Tax=unclassified Achromobacter TaxID=2626865 RepID=UPI000B51E01A|nr:MULTISPECIES: hypothetical protein [unclassified Achromobacter]OWT71480.1 hypothetical protein CEY05_25160 [Achromobacter sp. HZ34]OWT73137.1 hypothetical protein CEY04_23995 [Achromobacter sp. HZ28]